MVVGVYSKAEIVERPKSGMKLANDDKLTTAMTTMKDTDGNLDN